MVSLKDWLKETAPQIGLTKEGLIQGPGRLENEPAWAAYFDDIVGEGSADFEGDGWAICVLTMEEQEAHPDLADVYSVLLNYSDSGFVFSKTQSQKQHKEFLKKHEPEEEEEE